MFVLQGPNSLLREAFFTTRIEDATNLTKVTVGLLNQKNAFYKSLRICQPVIDSIYLLKSKSRLFHLLQVFKIQIHSVVSANSIL